jgi:NAD(P)H-hydrate epimerase
MYPVLTAQQIRDADACTITKEPVSSVDLMERASLGCFQWLKNTYDTNISFVVVCGQGNNGGDGLAIARMLSTQGYEVDVFILKLRSKGSSDFETNLKRLKKTNARIIIDDKLPDKNFFSEGKVIIDAIFGTGLNKPAEGVSAGLIHLINSSVNRVISIDVPSGLFSEGSNVHANEKNTVMASHTLTFQVPKLSFLLPDSGQYTGDFTILDIGLDAEFISSLETKYFLLEKGRMPLYPLHRKKYSHKGNYGHVLILAGSKGKTGAAILAAKACLRSGAGLVTVHTPKDSVSIVQAALPEAMVSVDPHKDFITQLPDISMFSTIAVGPGTGTEKQTAAMLKLLIQEVKTPLVLDADALNIMAENKTWMSFLPPGTIITPHPGEFDRLFGKTDCHHNRLQLQQEMSLKYNIIILLKGAHTSMSFPGREVIFNSTGNPGMSTAGSGDVLTGVIAALASQTHSPAYAALTGVYIHGYAGDIAADKYGYQSMISGDITEYLHEAFRQNQ